MRDYKQVVSERYDLDDFSGEGISKNIYSAINPVGNYGVYKITQVLRKYIRLLQKNTGKGLGDLKILDCGCGTGMNTRILSNLLGNTQNIYGFEFSRNRLEYCKRMNPNIHYEFGDITEVFPFSDVKFDGVMAFDVMTHIREEDGVRKCMKNIYDSMDIMGGAFSLDGCKF